MNYHLFKIYEFGHHTAFRLLNFTVKKFSLSPWKQMRKMQKKQWQYQSRRGGYTHSGLLTNITFPSVSSENVIHCRGKPLRNSSLVLCLVKVAQKFSIRFRDCCQKSLKTKNKKSKMLTRLTSSLVLAPNVGSRIQLLATSVLPVYLLLLDFFHSSLSGFTLPLYDNWSYVSFFILM